MNTHQRARAGLVATISTLTVLGLTLLVPARASGASDGADRGRPIYIGLITTLTGAQVGGGPYQQAGALLAVRQINAHGGVKGRPFKLVAADDRFSPARGIAALQRLNQRDHVRAVIYGGPAQVPALTPSIVQAGIPVIIGSTLPSATHHGNPWILRTRPSDIYAARALTAFAVTTLHLSRIALMYNNTTFGKEQGALARADLKALGITPVTERSYPVFGHDLTAQVLAIKKSGANALISFGNQPVDYRLLARQMRQVGVHLTWLGNPVLALTAILPGYGNLFNGTYAVTDYNAGQSTEATAFNRAIEATFHQPGNFASAWPYDGVQILAMVMRKVGTSPGAIRRGILAIRGYRGVEGTYNFDRYGDGLRQYTVVKNVQGRLQVVKVLSF